MQPKTIESNRLCLPIFIWNNGSGATDACTVIIRLSAQIQIKNRNCFGVKLRYQVELIYQENKAKKSHASVHFMYVYYISCCIVKFVNYRWEIRCQSQILCVKYTDNVTSEKSDGTWILIINFIFEMFPQILEVHTMMFKSTKYPINAWRKDLAGSLALDIDIILRFSSVAKM